MPNPFHPSFGVSPPLLVGRDRLIEEFEEGLEDGPGSAARATLYTGARGSGKTVMLNAIEDRARAMNWAVVSETASPGFVERITRQRLPQLLARLDTRSRRRRLTGVTAPLGAGGLTWDIPPGHSAEVGLRTQVERLTDLLSRESGGLLITLDEIHQHQIEELRQLATTVQHAFREERQLAFAGAGLASAITDVTSDQVLTFLRRAERHTLGPVGGADVRHGLLVPIEAGGRQVGEDALGVMAEGTRGYPFLIQLVGAQVWRLHPSEPLISLVDARRGVANALRRLGALIHEPAIADTSAIDRSFLLAMARDDRPSKMADIQARLGVDVNYASQYRLRLIAAEVILPAGRGYVDFALPYLREYLREHVASGCEALL